MKKMLLALLINFLSLHIMCMEKQESSAIEVKGVQAELWVEIALILSQSGDLREAIKNVQRLSRVNKALNELLNQPRVKQNLIKTITKQFKVNKSNVEILFGLPEAKEFLEKLLAKFKDRNEAGRILKQIFESENTIILNYLFQNGFDACKINEYLGSNIISFASGIFFGDVAKKYAMIKFLIEKGIDVNDLDNGYGNSILCYELRELCMFYRIESSEIKKVIEYIKYLLNCKANVNLKDDSATQTPLALAVFLVDCINNEYMELVKLLIESGAKVTEEVFKETIFDNKLRDFLNGYKK